jgi:predicted RNA binding protein YcfA (HicA-like mRNA interferase family)
VSSEFPSMRGRELLALLKRSPLSYREERVKGSHRALRSTIYRPVTFSFHDGQEIRPRTVRAVLVEQVGMTEDDALSHLRGDLK